MGLTGFSFLLVSSSSRHTAKSLIHSPFLFSAPKFSSPLIRKTQNFSFNGGQRFLSTVLQPETDLERSPGSRKTLSDRMSFVFDQLDMIESEKSGKDEALQQIRAWREQKSKTLSDKGVSGIVVSKTRDEAESTKNGDFFKQQAQVEVIHPWPEWIEFMERLLQQNYFDLRRRNEDCNAPVDALGFTEEGVDFTRDWTTVRTACLNFGRDRFDILRSLSRKDIQILVGHGCPSVDTKVVVSAKVLRKHVHLDEGDVCSSCSLRGSCDRAYLLTRKEDEARTLDVVRVLLTYGFDPLNGTVENKSLLKLKSVKSVVRKLLHEVVKLSAVPIDPNLPPPVIKKPPPKVKQPPPPPKKRVGRDDIEMKKGDWLCPKCDFMNFAKNTICLQCDANRPKRQLLPGEWECPKCNFLNYRRNMACFHCDHKRPPDEFVENQLQPRPHGPRTNLRRVADMPSISNAWNFDFDDNESDGADVAAFEYADPSRTDGSSDGQANRGSSRHFEDDPFETAQMQSIHERGKYSEPDRRKPSSAGPGTGFDDFDDEDDIDSYELDVTSNNSAQEASPTIPSRARGFSKSDDFDDSDDYSNSRRGIDSHSYSNSEDADRDFDSDNELREWKSSHVSDLRPLHGSRGRSGPYRGISFGLEDELVLDSDSDNDIYQGIKYKPNNGGKKGLNRKGNRRGRSSDGSEDGLLSDSESDDEGKRKSHRSMLGRDRAGPDRRGNTFSSGIAQEARFRSNDRRSDKRNCFGNGGHGGSFRASRASNSRGEGWNSRGAQRSGHGWSMNDTRGGLRDLDRPGHGEGFGYRQRGNRKEFNDRSGSVRGFGDNRQHQHRR